MLDDLARYSALSMAGGIACFALSLQDGISCLSANSDPRCLSEEAFALPVLRIMASNVTYLHGCFMLYGLTTRPSRSIAWFFLCSVCLDFAVRMLASPY